MRRMADGVAGSMRNVLSQAASVSVCTLLVVSIVFDGSLRREWIDAKHKYSWGESSPRAATAGSLPAGLINWTDGLTAVPGRGLTGKK